MAFSGPALGGFVLLFLSGCAWRVVPPPKATDPVPVYLSEYGCPPRLALPDDSTVFFEYRIWGRGISMGSKSRVWSPPCAPYRDSEKAHCQGGSFPTR